MNNPNFTAEGVLVLRLTEAEDRQGYVTPPECRVRFRQVIPVVFDSRDPAPVGMARLRREGNMIFADLTLGVTPYHPSYSAKMLGKLTPAACGRTKKLEENRIVEFLIEFIMLTPEENADEKIRPLGEKIQPIPDKREMH